MLVVCLVFIVIGGTGFALMHSGLLKGAPRPTESPEKVMLAFLEAKKTEDLEKCRPYLSRRSIEIIENTFGSSQARSAGFTMKDSADWALFSIPPTSREMAGRELTAKETKDDKEADSSMAIVHITVDAKEEPAPEPAQPESSGSFSEVFDFGPVDVDCVLVAEDGHWKVDIEKTNRRGLGLGKKGNPFRLGN